MNSKFKKNLLEEVIEIARTASKSIMAIYEKDFAIELKNDGSPLTKADESSHHIIQEGLTYLNPHLPVLSEESPEKEVRDRRNWKSYWLVDPLDGTKEFVKRNGEFTVNIALIEGNRATLGVVLAPALQIEYSGSIELGAWRQYKNQDKIKINTSLVHDRPIRIVGSRSHTDAALDKHIKTLGDYQLKKIGSSIKTCYIADGQADLYPRFGPTSEWDTAAAQAILESAGGSMIDLFGQPLRYNTKDDFLNPNFIAFGNPNLSWLQSFIKNSGKKIETAAFKNVEKLKALRVTHQDLDQAISRLKNDPDLDQITLKRLKKRKLLVKDMIARLESDLIPDINA